jgi:benzoyl-CoA reductase/2-hydroxyglutaryl-CoA dehydratase subunit BcrC/BadD/HgdB
LTLSAPSVVKKTFKGWFSGDETCEGQQYFENNIAQGNPIDQYDADPCKNYDANRIHLHAKYEWKQYEVEYSDTGSLQFCKYN